MHFTLYELAQRYRQGLRTVRLSFRENQFSPSETEAMTGLSQASQRDWRMKRYLRPRDGGRTSFTSRDIGEIRVMVTLRGMGVAVADSKAMAGEVVRSVIYLALANHPHCLAIDADEDRATRYRDFLEVQTSDGYLRTIAEVETGGVIRFGILHREKWRLRSSLDDDAVDDSMEGSALINFSATAAVIAATAPRPLYTLIVPASFQ